MKVAFITTDPENCRDPYPPFTPCLISAVAEKNRHMARVVEFSHSMDSRQMEEKMGGYDVFWIDSDTESWPILRKAALFLRQYFPSKPLILSGSHPTLFPDYLLKSTGARLIVAGEIERTLTDLLSCIKKKKNPEESAAGIIYADGEKTVFNPPAKPLSEKEYEQLPFPRFEDIYPDRYPYVPLETSRGRAFYSPTEYIFNGGPWRQSSPTKIYEGLYRIREHFSGNQKDKPVFITDRYFTARAKNLFDFWEICKKKSAEFRMIYRARVSDFLNENIIDYIGPYTGLVFMEPGSGCNRGLRKLKRSIGTGHIRDVAKLFSVRGLARMVRFDFNVGFPWETAKDCMDTVGFALSLKKNFGVGAKVTPFQHTPGSPLWQEHSDFVDPSVYDNPPASESPIPVKNCQGITDEEWREVLSAVSEIK